MTLLRLLTCLAAAACLSGCAVSVRPLYTDRLVVSEPSLAGAWQGSKETLTFVKCEDTERTYRAYDLHMVTGEEVTLWRARLVKLGDDLYLDLLPREPTLPNLQKMVIMPLHMISRVTVAPDELTVQCDYDMGKLRTILRADPLTHVNRGEQVVITASTAELQEFFKKHGREVFLESRRVFRRKTDGQ
jgi:hypothetical protein